MRFRNFSPSKALLVLALFCLFPGVGQAKLLGSVGRTYPIAEPDFIEEVRTRANQVDIKAHVDPEKVKKRVKEFKPSNLVVLPKTTKGRTFKVDMTYVLDMDIPDGKGGILYPKGYTYNPMDYLLAPVPQMVVINGDDPEQVEWFARSAYSRDMTVRLLLAGGSYFDVGEKLGRPAFFLMQPVAEKFKLQSAPCVIRPQGKMMEVEEILLPDKKKGA